MMRPKTPRLAVRAIIKHEGKLLLVNAYPDDQSALMCAPGGGIEVGSSLPDNLKREIYEETGLAIEVGAPCLVNEFHDPMGTFHQVDVYFHCRIVGSAQIDQSWTDPEAVVSKWQWVTRRELAQISHKPDSLDRVAFGTDAIAVYDPLEPIVR